MRYNGWRNWATWNANLWVMNDEGLYREWVQTDRRHGGEWDSDLAKDFIAGVFPEGTPDMHGTRDLLDVDYEELADNWTEE